MAGKGIEVDHVTLRKAASDVSSARDEVIGQLGALDREAEKMRGGWEGQAAATFQALMAQYARDARQLTDAMEDIATLLKKSAGAHEQADAESQAAVNRIASTLNPS